MTIVSNLERKAFTGVVRLKSHWKQENRDTKSGKFKELCSKREQKMEEMFGESGDAK